MSIEGLSRSLDLVSLDRDTSDCLPFTPHKGEEWLESTFDRVPQYLFRVSFHGKSDGETTKVWAKSKDAKEKNPGRETSILDGDQAEMADMLYRHLRWKGGSPSNLLSWTSSLLFALQYVFYRHHKDLVALEDITIFVIDTTKLPMGAFVRDLDLLSIFSKFNEELCALKSLRTRYANTPAFLRCYYFGEYLSQGALRIEGKCGSATGREIIDRGLFSLRAEFKDSLMPRSDSDLGWANRVLNLRECFGQVEVEDEQKENLELQVTLAFEIGSLFGPGWEPPIAASLLGLRRRSMRDVDAICKASVKFAARYNIFFSESQTDLRVLPEVQQFETIMLGLARHLHLGFIHDQISIASSSLTRALNRRGALFGNEAFSANETLPSRKMIGEYIVIIARINNALLKDLPKLE